MKDINDKVKLLVKSMKPGKHRFKDLTWFNVHKNLKWIITGVKPLKQDGTFIIYYKNNELDHEREIDFYWFKRNRFRTLFNLITDQYNEIIVDQRNDKLKELGL
jgi:hypothetical protein